jgi:hypothetical protein
VKEALGDLKCKEQETDEEPRGAVQGEDCADSDQGKGAIFAASASSVSQTVSQV